MRRSSRMFAIGFAVGLGFCGFGSARAETVMQQCGQQYQAAKSAGTLNGMTWNQFRSDCAAKLKAQPALTTHSRASSRRGAATGADMPILGGRPSRAHGNATGGRQSR